MKKLLLAGLILTLLAGTASAQTGSNRIRHQREAQSFRHGQLNRAEVRHLKRDGLRYRMANRRAHRDGRITRFERRRLIAMKRDQRHDRFRFRHNNRRRLI